MRTERALIGFLAAVAVAVQPAVAVDAPQDAAPSGVQKVSEIPQLPATPSRATVPAVVLLRPVVLASQYPTDFREDHQQVRGGWLMVIRADSAILAPRAVAEPLLLAGGKDWTESVEWFNHGYASGHRVCFIPSQVDEQGKLTRTTKDLRVWFGSPQLPESVSPADLVAQRALADRAGIEAAAQAQVDSARGGRTADAPEALADRDALVAAAGELIAKWAPDEAHPVAAAPATGK